MEKLIRTIPVRDANGTPLTLFEFQHSAARRAIFGLRFASKRKHPCLPATHLALSCERKPGSYCLLREISKQLYKFRVPDQPVVDIPRTGAQPTTVNFQ